jgi:hypothetical protein
MSVASYYSSGDSVFALPPESIIDESQLRLRDWGSPVEGQSLSVTAPKSTIRAGEQTNVEFRLRNVSREDIGVAYDREMRPQFMFALRVIYADGKEVPLTKEGRRQAQWEKDRSSIRRTGTLLKPGEEFVSGVNLSRLYDLSTAGKYVITAKKKLSKNGDENSQVEATSNKFELTVVEPYASSEKKSDADVIGQPYEMKIPAFDIPQSAIDGSVEAPLMALHAATANLIEQLHNTRENETILQCAYMLGEMRATAAIPALVAKIEFKAARADNRKPGAPRWKRFPAEEALVKIGNPAVNPIVLALAVEEDRTRRKLMVEVLCGVLGKDVADFVLKKAAADVATIIKKEKYEQARSELHALKP